jgi:hypothetical protein
MFSLIHLVFFFLLHFVRSSQIPQGTSLLAVRFAKLTQQSSSDSVKTATQPSMPDEEAALTSVSTSGGLTATGSRIKAVGSSSIVHPIVPAKGRLMATNSVSGVGSSRYSYSTENMPKLTDLRKILNPEEERKDLETTCKSFWDSFIDCQCIECTFNNAAKFITAFILFLTLALIINSLTVSSSSSSSSSSSTGTPNTIGNANNAGSAPVDGNGSSLSDRSFELINPLRTPQSMFELANAPVLTFS